MPNQHTGREPRNKPFHDWFYSLERRMQYNEGSDFYRQMRSAWEEATRRVREEATQSLVGWRHKDGKG